MYAFQKLRDYLDLEHRNKKGTPFDFEDWIDYDPDVRTARKLKRSRLTSNAGRATAGKWL